jgi:hypothetical protein
MTDPDPLTLAWFLDRINRPEVNSRECDAIRQEACQCEFRGLLREPEAKEIKRAIESKKAELAVESNQLLIGAAKLPRRQPTLF